LTFRLDIKKIYVHDKKLRLIDLFLPCLDEMEEKNGENDRALVY
jgi:hypothetical protein